jgi:pimeloyl-ACP methyl ester carboxylesterase
LPARGCLSRLGLELLVLGDRHVRHEEGERRPLLEVQVGTELLHHGRQIPGDFGAVGGEVPVGVGQVGEALPDLVQDAVELVMLRDQLVQVHPVFANPRRQRRIEQRVLMGVVGDQLLSIVVVELPHSGQPAFPIVGLQGGDRGHQARAVSPEGLMSEIDEDEVGLGSIGGHSASYAVAALPSLTAVDGVPTTKYATNGDVHLAYQVLGEGPLDLVLIESWVTHVEAFWEIPELARQRRRLAGMGRLIIFDRRGTGLSDPVPLDRLPDLETQVADICAVMDAAGSRQAAILGFTEGGPLALLLAASLPDRCRALVLCNTAARLSAASDYPWAAPEEVLLEIVRRQAQSWAAGDADHLPRLAPSRVSDPHFTERHLRLGRVAVSPGAVAHYFRQSVLIDVRELLPVIQAPTLVLHRAHDQIAPPELGRYLADHIPDARFVEIDGSDHIWFTENADELVGEVEEFLTGTRASPDPDRRLATVLFTDIVDSTARAAAVGDTRWRALLDEHDSIVRQELARFGGHEVDTTGDGFLATFDGPGRAISCARALHDALARIGLAVRVGVHTGEVEVRGAQIGGLAVHIGARVAATGGGGDVVVSSTVKDLVAGSGLTFVDLGEHELKGVPGAWRLFAVEVDG